jgi:hypothetical protein
MLGAPSVAAQTGGETLRFVAQADLKIVDPIWTTAYITRNHGYLVYDTLFGTDPDRLSPRLAGVRIVRSAMVAGLPLCRRSSRAGIGRRNDPQAD